MKDLKECLVKEAKEIRYQVAFGDCVDEEDLPISVTILVDHEYKDIFDKFLKDEEGNIFMHADNGNDIQY